jgi:hypothetical protein
MHDFARGKGSVFEDEKHRGLNTTRWIAKFDPATRYRRLLSDVNRWKTFLINRYTSPQGSRGSISLFKTSPELHELYATHICKSEYPEPVTAKGHTLFEWKEAGNYNNDLLDCSAGCMALASLAGCRLRDDLGSAENMEEEGPDTTPRGNIQGSTPRKTEHRKTTRRRLKASELVAAKRKGRQSSSYPPR